MLGEGQVTFKDLLLVGLITIPAAVIAEIWLHRFIYTKMRKMMQLVLDNQAKDLIKLVQDTVQVTEERIIAEVEGSLHDITKKVVDKVGEGRGDSTELDTGSSV